MLHAYEFAIYVWFFIFSVLEINIYVLQINIYARALCCITSVIRSFRDYKQIFS